MTSDIAGYDDWPAVLPGRPPVAGDDVATAVARALGVRTPRSGTAEAGATESVAGVERTELRWHTGLGPATRAWYLRPAGAGDTPLPALLALSRERQVGGGGAAHQQRPSGRRPGLRRALRRPAARRGAGAGGVRRAAPDAFGWGSRRFTLDPLPRRVDRWLAAEHRAYDDPDVRYDAAAALHEPTAAKYAGALGTSLAGMAAHDDLAAFVPHHLDAHSWYFAVPGLPPQLDWPDVAAGRRAHRQLVLYAEEDELFPLDGMRAADELLRQGFPDGRYEGAWFPGPHRFDVPMQERAAQFLAAALG